MQAIARMFSGRVHYAWIVVAATFLSLLAAAGVRATPSVLIVPLETAFGWTRAMISVAIAINIFLYGLTGPFAAALMQRIGVRQTVVLALAATAGSVLLSTFMTQPWQLIATWGVMVGIGTGSIALVLGATVVNRWFVTNRGLAMGILTAATATGQLVFLPMLAAVAGSQGWQPVALIVAAVAAAMIPIFLLLVPEQPDRVGLTPLGQVGASGAIAASTANPIVVAFTTLGRGARSRHFWLLFASFFVCGLSTNGLIGTHLISACLDYGIAEVTAAGLLAAMGIFDLIGTTASGWLSDRVDNRILLFWYYGLRGLALIFLPYTNFEFLGLSVFAVFYGLDWIATVPPTVRLTSDIFGKADAPILFGWILSGHQMGAAVAAFGAGYIRTSLDSYLLAFIIAGVFCVATAFLVLAIGRGSRPALPAGAATA